jgi:hypothetical protein
MISVWLKLDITTSISKWWRQEFSRNTYTCGNFREYWNSLQSFNWEIKLVFPSFKADWADDCCNQEVRTEVISYDFSGRVMDGPKGFGCFTRDLCYILGDKMFFWDIPAKGVRKPFQDLKVICNLTPDYSLAYILNWMIINYHPV